MSSPIRAIRGPFRVERGGWGVELTLRPEGLVSIILFDGLMESTGSETPVRLGEVVVSAPSWSFALREPRDSSNDEIKVERGHSDQTELTKPRETVRADRVAKLLLEQTALVTRVRKQLMVALRTIDNAAREAMRQMPADRGPE